MSDTTARQKWVLDPGHSEIEFKVRHLMVSNVKGNFNQFEASVYTPGTDFKQAEIECSINSSSVDTGNVDRDQHLRSADFFNVEQFPKISFKSTKVENPGNDSNYMLWGDLTIAGVTRNIKLDVEFGGIQKDPWGNEKAGFSINGKINRGEFNLVWNAPLEAGGVLVSDEVRITAEVQLIRAN